MSNAMSRSKSRWKGALLATVAAAVVSPVVAKAQSTGLTVGIYANPLGGAASPNLYSGTSNVYIDPSSVDTLYVYATVTGAAAPSTSYVDGLDYLYFNVNATTAGTAGLGIITAATPSAQFGGGSFNQTTGNTAGTAGAQGGFISTTAYSSTLSIAVGSNSSIGSIAKPRSSSDFYWNSPTGSGANVVVSGNNVSFLVETLTYTPNSAAVLANPSSPTPGTPNSVSFNVSIPSSTITATGPYTAANYFVGLPATPAVGASPGLSNTSSGYTSSTSNISLTNALPGDDNLDGSVSFADFSIFANNYGKTSGATFEQGDFNGDGAVSFADFSIFANYYTKNAGGSPAGFATALAEVEAANPTFAAELQASSVPEPTTLGLGVVVASGALLRRRSRLANKAVR